MKLIAPYSSSLLETAFFTIHTFGWSSLRAIASSNPLYSQTSN